MPSPAASRLYDDPDDPELDRLARRFAWFAAVLEVDYGERDADREIPAALHWLADLSDDVRYGFDDVECSLGFEDGATGYVCTVWDVSGPDDDLPWAVYVVDDYGARLLPEYSVLDPDADYAALEAALRRAAEEIPDRLLAGEFTRSETPLEIPPHLKERLDPMEQPRSAESELL